MSGCSQVFVEGLFVSTDYQTRIRAGSDIVPLNSHTLNLTDPDYTFVVASDVHITDTNSRGLERLNGALISSDKFVVITGDIADSGTAVQLQTFRDIAAVMSVPCFAAIGNHELYFGNWPNWKRLIGGTFYRRDSGDTTLIFLDSANATFGKEQIEWLEGQLKTAKKHTFLFTHSNFFNNKIDELQQFTDIRERNRVISLLEGNADAMFAGHNHQRTQVRAGSVWYVTNEDFRSHRSYLRVTVSPAGMSFRYHALDE